MSAACTSDQRRTGAEQESAEVGTGTEQAAAASTAAAPLAGATLTKDTPPPSRTPAPAGRAYLRLVVVLGLLIALGPLTIDMYLPALPQLTEDLRATEPQAQFTLTGIMIGLGLGQLVLGPVSDAVGRRKVLLSGVVVHGLMSVLCALAPSIVLLSVVRVGQGVAGAAISVVAMAVVRDLFSGRKAAKLLSHLTLVLGAAPVLAPSLGGFLLDVTSWRGIFWVLGGAAVLLVALAWFGLTETLPAHRRRPLALGSTGRTYRSLLRDRTFVGLVLLAGLNMSTVFTYVSGSSFVFQDHYGLDARTYGLVFGLNALGLIAATQLNPFLLRRYAPQQVLTTGIGIAMVSTLALVVSAAADGPLWTLLIPLFVSVSACGLSFPNAPALALSRHGEAAGTAAALLGATQFGLAGIITPVVGFLGSADAVPMASVMAAIVWVAAIVLVTLVRPWTLPLTDPADDEADAAEAADAELATAHA
jgi:DHA1 family bicyclomycin/chloramphenicol resistance-like MFS transporter